MIRGIKCFVVLTMLRKPFPHQADTVGQRFFRKRTGECIFYLREHIGQNRFDVPPDDTFVAGILMEVKDAGRFRFIDRLIDLKERKFLRFRL